MFSARDLEKFKSYKIEPKEINRQLEIFKKGFSFAKILKPALVDDGIIRLDEITLRKFVQLWLEKKENFSILKFVPASGAASRMFKSLFEYRETYTGSSEDYQHFMDDKSFGSAYYFFKHLDDFPFWPDLKAKIALSGENIEECLLKKNYVKIVDYIMSEKGLNYGYLPKGLIHFHQCKSETRRAFDEHLVEAALYAVSKHEAHLHFTVSPEHLQLFKAHMQAAKLKYEKAYKVKFKVEFSNQHHYTDTIAVDEQNQPFRDENKNIILRPGGHGALIENLNQLDSDIVFIKNIDNVAPDSAKPIGVKYKQALAGVLLYFKGKIFDYLEKMEQVETLDVNVLDEIGLFLQDNLCIKPPEDFTPKNPLERIKYLYKKLNRPIRVCGMVKNEGEPGGGPFWAENADGSASLQIIESAQIDMQNAENKELLLSATHFNPVDIVCFLKDFTGEKFDLAKYIDEDSIFIAEKSYKGRKLKALERPGLWNGAMADWITIFVEVPIETFTPVKTIHDLLRKEHRD